MTKKLNFLCWRGHSTEVAFMLLTQLPRVWITLGQEILSWLLSPWTIIEIKAIYLKAGPWKLVQLFFIGSEEKKEVLSSEFYLLSITKPFIGNKWYVWSSPKKNLRFSIWSQWDPISLLLSFDVHCSDPCATTSRYLNALRDRLDMRCPKFSVRISRF